MRFWARKLHSRDFVRNEGLQLLADQVLKRRCRPALSGEHPVRGRERAQSDFEPGVKLVQGGGTATDCARDRLNDGHEIGEAVRELTHQRMRSLFVRLALANVSHDVY